VSEHAPEPQNEQIETPPVEQQAEETPWQGPSREEWEQAQRFQEAALPILQQVYSQQQGQPQQQEPQQPQGPAAPELDPFDPNSVKAYIDYQTDQRTSRYEDMVRLVEAREGEQLARQELERLQGEMGEFDGDTAMVIAAGMLDQGMDPGRALTQAAQYLTQHEARIREDERKKHGVMLQTHNEAPREGAASQGAAQEAGRVPTGPNRYESAVENFLASRRATLPMG
jgi:hypothetical protein